MTMLDIFCKRFSGIDRISPMFSSRLALNASRIAGVISNLTAHPASFSEL
ncbi:MAG: hypothetical protein AB1717_03010 [Pseudomonadota bacterium]